MARFFLEIDKVERTSSRRFDGMTKAWRILYRDAPGAMFQDMILDGHETAEDAIKSLAGTLGFQWLRATWGCSSGPEKLDKTA